MLLQPGLMGVPFISFMLSLSRPQLNYLAHSATDPETLADVDNTVRARGQQGNANLQKMTNVLPDRFG